MNERIELTPSDMLESAKCPITKEKMVNPVVVLDSGISYEGSALHTWRSVNNTDPQTREPITGVMPNFTLKNVLSEIDEKSLVVKDDNQIVTKRRMIKPDMLEEVINLVYQLFDHYDIKI